MTDELLDPVNDKDEVIGTVFKSQAHQDPKLIHREISVAVFNEKGEDLLQQRSMSKLIDPGKWIISVAGHVGAGEDPKEAARREVKEELGLDIDPIYFEKQFLTTKGKESRFFWIYLCHVQGRPQLELSQNEVMDARWVKLSKLNEFSRQNYFPEDSASYKFIVKMADVVLSALSTD